MLDLTNLPNKAPEYDLRQLFEANLHFGHKVAEWNPRMKQFIYTHKNGVHIFDLAKTAKQLQKAYNAVYQAASENKSVVLVGTKTQAREVVEAKAKAVGMNYVVSRWLGGLLTNWEQVSKSLKRMIKTEEKLKKGEYKGYTKYEIVQIEKDVNRLRRFFDGLRGLTDKPDLIIMVDPVKENVAVKEANIASVPTIALIDSNGNPDQITIPVPGNDDAVKSIEFFVTEITQAYQEGKTGKKTQSAKGKTKSL